VEWWWWWWWWWNCGEQGNVYISYSYIALVFVISCYIYTIYIII
jgi:hypothetical protein